MCHSHMSSYGQQAPQGMLQYAPLSPPSSPIYYHFSPQASASPSSPSSAGDGLSQLMGRPSIQLMQSMSQMNSPQAQSSQAQVVEVPVPVYLPMMMGRMGRGSSPFAVGQAPVHSRRLVMNLPRQMMMMPTEARAAPVELPMMTSSGADSRASGGHVALLMVQHSSGGDHPQGGESHSESLVMPQHVEPSAPMSFSPSSSSASSSDEPASAFVRIFLRPKMSSLSAPIAGSRIAFHRRLDDSPGKLIFFYNF